MRNREFDFVATDVITPFHLASVLSLIERTVGHSQSVKCCVYLLPNLNGAFILPAGEYALRRGGTLYVRQSTGRPRTVANLAKYLLAVCCARLSRRDSRRPLWVVHHTYPKPHMLEHAAWRDVMRGVAVATFEEGIGTYGGALHHGRSVAGKMFSLSAVAKYFIRMMMRWSWPPRLDSRPMKDGDDGTMLAAIRDCHDLMAPGPVGNRSAATKIDVLIAGSPAVELGWLSRDAYDLALAVVKDLVDESCTVVAKPHPLEIDLSVYRKYGFHVAESHLPAEVLVANTDARVVVGFGTGLLVTARQFVGVTTIDGSVLFPDFSADRYRHTGRVKELYGPQPQTLEEFKLTFKAALDASSR